MSSRSGERRAWLDTISSKLQGSGAVEIRSQSQLKSHPTTGWDCASPRRRATETSLGKAILERMRFEPAQHLVGVEVGREDRVEDVLDAPVANHQREPLEQDLPDDLEGR